MMCALPTKTRFRTRVHVIECAIVYSSEQVVHCTRVRACIAILVVSIHARALDLCGIAIPVRTLPSTRATPCCSLLAATGLHQYIDIAILQYRYTCTSVTIPRVRTRVPVHCIAIPVHVLEYRYMCPALIDFTCVYCNSTRVPVLWRLEVYFNISIAVTTFECNTWYVFECITLDSTSRWCQGAVACE